MNVDTTERPATVRDRILAAATELFYAQGIRATSADRIIEAVGTTKVTFYRHFRTKGDLVVAYLEGQAAAEREWMNSAQQSGDPVASLRALATGIGAASCSPGFRGCPFINAAAEYSDSADSVRVAVDAHREWTYRQFAEIAAEASVNEPESVGRQLMILRDGAMVNGYLGDPTVLADSLGAAFVSITR
ncbi:MAG: TetR/AcrR family transcriptional regulator [Rhodoglobus sp.]|nr:TetR/AcrR family transcriptional regulator [Rhodoglobus sp.]